MLIDTQVRVVTRYMGSGISGFFRGGIRDYNPGIWNHNPWDRDQQCFCGIRDQNSQRFGDQGSKFSTFLRSGIKISGKNTESVMKKYTSLRPCQVQMIGQIHVSWLDTKLSFIPCHRKYSQ